MARNVLDSLSCKICGHECKRPEGLSMHSKLKHNMSNLEYTAKILLNGIIPLCECGCGKEVKVHPYKVNECYRGHSGGGNWQTKYDKDSIEYKAAVSKISKSVKEYMAENPPTVTEENRLKQSKYMIELMSNPEEKIRRVTKMMNTKKKQSEDGTLSKNHFTKTKTKDEVEYIYNKIGSKASKTKVELFSTGDLVTWNKGKNKKTDNRIANSAGENHYRFNPDKEVVYTEKFYDKDYRKLLMIHQDSQCFNCGIVDKSLCLHHVDENKRNDSFKNLIFVCRSCHSKIHNNKELQHSFNECVEMFKQNIILNNKQKGK